MKSTRAILLYVVILYFFNSQVTPYFHFHHHNHSHSHTTTLSLPDKCDNSNNNLCCEQHTHKHSLLHADWNALITVKNITKYNATSVVGIVATVSHESLLNTYVAPTFQHNSPHKHIFSKHFNKAPPIAV